MSTFCMTHNRINYIIKGFLAVGIVVLFIHQFYSKQKNVPPIDLTAVRQDTVAMLSFAYINVDSLLLNYYLAIDLRSQIVIKEENSRSIITQRIRDLEIQMRRYKKQLEENPFIPREQSDADYQQIMNKQRDIYQLDRQLSEELQKEQDRVYEQLYDSIIQQLRRYNEVRKISIIFSNTGGDNILYAKDIYNATPEVIDFLNEKFTSPAFQDAFIGKP